MQIHCSICWEWEFHSIAGPTCKQISTESVRPLACQSDSDWFFRWKWQRFDDFVCEVNKHCAIARKTGPHLPTRQRGQGTQEPFVLYNKKTHLVVEFWFFLGPIFSLLVVNGHHHQVISDHVESSSTYIVCLKLASAVKLSLAAQKTSFLSPMHSSTPEKQKLNFVKFSYLWNPDYGRFPKFNLRHPKQEGFLKTSPETKWIHAVASLMILQYLIFLG